MSVDLRTTPVRFSTLKAIGRSPAHYRAAVLTEREDSAAMRLGRLVHWHVLGGMPDDEEGRIAIYNGERRGNAWKEFADEHKGDEIVTVKEWERALPIADAVRTNSLARMLLDGATMEKRVFWKSGGREMSSRPDAFGSFGVYDLKTTSDASLIGLQRQAWRMGYHAQLAMYQDALEQHGITIPGAYVIGVETKPPYPVTVMRLSHRLVDVGRRTYRQWMETLRVCEDNDHWPEYSESMVQWDVPEWFEGEDDEDEQPDDPEGGGEEEAAQ